MAVNTPYLPHGKLYHFFVGTPGILSIHTKEVIIPNQNIEIGNQKLFVTEVSPVQSSTYYPGFNFYQLKFKNV